MKYFSKAIIIKNIEDNPVLIRRILFVFLFLYLILNVATFFYEEISYINSVYVVLFCYLLQMVISILFIPLIKKSGRSGLWALLGFFSVVGFIVLLFLIRKNKILLNGQGLQVEQKGYGKFIALNIFLSPIIAMFVYPLFGWLAMVLNSENFLIDVILPVTLASLIVSGLCLAWLKLKNAKLNKQLITSVVLVPVAISTILAPITLGLVVMSSYFLYCQFGVC